MLIKRSQAAKRGQAAGAAVLLAIIMGLIILFILLIPPKERAELLGEKTAPSLPQAETKIPAKIVIKEVLLQEIPGRLTYLKEKEIEKAIPAAHIFTKTESSLLEERDFLSLKKGAFSSQPAEIYFNLEDLNLVDNVLLDFNIESYSGNLIILLNGKEIFNKETNKIKPLKLSSTLLQKENTLTFQVSSPGLAFWKVNQYQLKNLKIVADLTDISSQESRHLFYVSPDETRNLEQVTLRFSLGCLPEKQGKIKVALNDHQVFSGTPENCEDLFYYDLPPQIIKSGNNWLSFQTPDGDYQISLISVSLKLESPSYPVYYFQIDQEFFTAAGREASCGEIDGLCPDSCDEDADKDCCFETYSTPFWCDAPTSNSDDRCVGHVDSESCERCSSGYEDEDGNPPSACQSLCGDDTDHACPANCNINYDQDCCFLQEGPQFWCGDLPTTGLDFTCVGSVSRDECPICPAPDSYEGEEASPDCPEEEEEKEEARLKKDYQLILTLEFTDEERKEAEIYLNGHKISFDTYKVEFSYDLADYAEPWTNSLKIVPQNSFDVKELTVELKS